MIKRRLLIILLVLAGVVTAVYCFTKPPTGQIVLTGIVTTDDVIVSSQIQGRLQKLSVKEGDTVATGQVLGLIEPEVQNADVMYYTNLVQQNSALVRQAQAQLENAQAMWARDEPLFKQNAISEQDYVQAKTAKDAAEAYVNSLNKQVEAAQAQLDKAKAQQSYTKIVAPMNSIVDTRAAREGEVVNPGQPILTLINEDDLWVRADVEETYIDRIHIGDTMDVKLPSGDIRSGKVFYRGVDADFATQRDVSRTKRDIRTFEVRLRCDNRDRGLAVGMTAYVILPLK